MHGDIALVEAALSARSFYKLTGFGVPFPPSMGSGYAYLKVTAKLRRRKLK